MDTPNRRTLLEGLRSELRERIQRYEDHRHRISGVLDKDLEDQVAQTQNDEVVDRLEEEAKEELTQVEKALTRIDAHQGERCEKCGGTITTERLGALPYTTCCKDCVSS